MHFENVARGSYREQHVAYRDHHGREDAPREPRDHEEVSRDQTQEEQTSLSTLAGKIPTFRIH